MKKIISRILVGLLVLILLISLISPAFAATDEAAVETMASNSEPVSPLLMVLGIFVLFLIPISSFMTIKYINVFRYRKRAERLIRDNMPYVKMTGLSVNEIRAHLATFSDRNGHLSNMDKHFLEELYSLLLTKKSEALAATDEAAKKDKQHLSIRADMYRKLLAKNYTYNDFLNLRPLNPEEDARLFADG